MSKNQNLAVSQLFDPNQVINLNCKTNEPNSQNATKKVSTKINLAQKINLKNYISTAQKKSRKPRRKVQTLNKVKIEETQKNQSPPMKNLDIYEESDSIQLASKEDPSNQAKTPSPLEGQLPIEPMEGMEPIEPTELNNIQLQIQDQIEPENLQLQSNTQNLGDQREKPQLGVKLENLLLNNQSVLQNPRKHKISVLSSDFVSMRYECFCSRQYFTYCSIYNHLKREHQDFLKENRRFSFTNIYQTSHPAYGYRIKKIMRHRLKLPGGEKADQVQKLTKHAKQKIKDESIEIQKLVTELRDIESQRGHQIQKLRLFQRRFQKASELIKQYQTMISSFQNIFNVLNIKQISKKLNSGLTVLEQQPTVNKQLSQ